MRVNLKHEVTEEEEMNVLLEDEGLYQGIIIVPKGAINELLDRLIFPLDQGIVKMNVDMYFAQIFLTAYRNFLTSDELFDFILSWYTHTVVDMEEKLKLTHAEIKYRKMKTLIEQRCRNILLEWISSHWTDFQCNKVLSSKLDDFVNELSKDSFSNNQKFVHAIREQVRGPFKIASDMVHPSVYPNVCWS
jgi:hypothetical protein